MANGTTSKAKAPARSVNYPTQVAPSVSAAQVGLVTQLEQAAKNRIPRR